MKINAKKRPSDSPEGKRHRAHPKNGALWHDCVECNPLADEKTFL